jgi:hypothetical protein
MSAPLYDFPMPASPLQRTVMISGLRHRAAEQQQSRTATKLPACIKKIKKNQEE